jgi:hypothetical protein
MIDDLAGLAVAAAIDVATKEGAKKHRWVRILLALVGLLFFALVAGAIYITFKYS